MTVLKAFLVAIPLVALSIALWSPALWPAL
jgi:hypothetical protein